MKKTIEKTEELQRGVLQQAVAATKEWVMDLEEREPEMVKTMEAEWQAALHDGGGGKPDDPAPVAEDPAPVVAEPTIEASIQKMKIAELRGRCTALGLQMDCVSKGDMKTLLIANLQVGAAEPDKDAAAE